MVKSTEEEEEEEEEESLLVNWSEKKLKYITPYLTLEGCSFAQLFTPPQIISTRCTLLLKSFHIVCPPP